MEEKITWVDQNRNTYGPFSIQKDGFPNAGEVMEFYRIKKGLSRSQLAQKLGVTSRRVQIMEHNNEVFESITRRRALAEMIGVPLFLFSLASNNAVQPLKQAAEILTRTTVDKETIEQYSEVSRLYWSLYYTGSNVDISADISRNIQKIHSILPYAGDMRPEVVEQLSSFYELASRVSMDQFATQQSVNYIEDALRLVEPDDVELYGRLLYKKGMSLFEAKRFNEAQVALEQAYTFISYLSTPLVGSILLQLALVRSYQMGDNSNRSAATTLFKRAGTIARSKPLEVEGIRFDEGRFLTAYGEGLINLGHYEDAEDILEQARIKTGLNLPKRLMMIDIQEIRLYVAQKEYPIVRNLAEATGEKRNLKSPRTTQTIEEIIRSIPGKKTR